MLLDRPNWPFHRPWCYLFLAGTAVAAAWYAATAWGAPHLPGGSSLPGFVFGVVGGLICLFEFLLWARKKVRVWRVGRTQTWMRAHIWLGLLTLPLLVLHSGFRFGGTLSTILMVLLIVVVLSGIWGLILQNLVPQKMLEDVPAETIYSQIDRLSGQLEEDAWQMVALVCGLARRPGAKEAEPADAYVVVGAVRQVGMVQGKAVGTQTLRRAVPGCEPLAHFFDATVSPYLLRGKSAAPILAQPLRARALFDNLRVQVPAEAHDVVAQLDSACQQRRQWDTQAQLHFWLHNWLWVHFPLSVALIVLMFVHVWVALKYY